MTSILRALGALAAEAITLYDGTADAVTSDQTGDAVDLAGLYEGDMLLEGNLSHAGSGGGSGTLKVQESDDGSTGWTDISGASCTCDSNTPGRFRKVVDLAATKRFVRSFLDITGSVSVVADVTAMAFPAKKAS